MLDMDNPKGLFAVRMRIVKLKLMRQSLLHMMPEDGTWDWFIDQCVSDLEDYLKTAKQNMAAPVGHHMIMQFEKLSIASISQEIMNHKQSEFALSH